MLDRFVAYSLAHPPGPENRYTTLGRMVFTVLRGSSGVFDDEALTLSAEVERLVRENFGERGRAIPSVREAVASVLLHLTTWADPEGMRTRFEGAVSQVAGTSPRTALRVLAAEHVIAKRHLRAWEDARNPAAHGLRTSRSVREQLLLNDQIHQLFLLLVFHLIGYTGPFTDHTVKGYPPVESPLALVEAIMKEDAHADTPS